MPIAGHAPRLDPRLESEVWYELFLIQRHFHDQPHYPAAATLLVTQWPHLIVSSAPILFDEYPHYRRWPKRLSHIDLSVRGDELWAAVVQEPHEPEALK